MFSGARNRARRYKLFEGIGKSHNCAVTFAASEKFGRCFVEERFDSAICSEVEVHDAGEYFKTCFEEDVDVNHGHWQEKGFEPATGLLKMCEILFGSLAVGVGVGVLGSLLFKFFGQDGGIKAVCGSRGPTSGGRGGAGEQAGLAGGHGDRGHGGGEHASGGPGDGEHGGGGHAVEHAMVEVAMFFFVSLASFYFAEIGHLSGIISSLFAGMICNHYMWHNLSKPAQELSKHFFEQMMVIMENLVCIWVGVVFIFAVDEGHINLKFSLVALFLVVASRGATVFPLALVANTVIKVRGQPVETQISMSYQCMMFTAGLRGAIALVLVLGLPPGRFNADIEATTVFIVLVTNVVLGGATVPVVRYLKIPCDKDGTLSTDADERLGMTGKLWRCIFVILGISIYFVNVCTNCDWSYMFA